jgi:hypothetical protein
MKKDEFDIFVNYTVYPTAENIFNASLMPIEGIKDECIFVLDTNALLLPYSTGSQSLTEINKVFEKLKQQNRLIVPGQVAREFANNRPEKLKEIFQQLNRKQSSIQSLGIGKYPLLGGIGDYKKAIEIEKEINEKLVQYRKAINTLVEQVKQWTWDDPVSLMYRNIFTKEVLLDISIDKDKIKQELEYRYLHKIPPGFKDDGKPDDGIGDLIIWLTILEIAKGKKHVVFVSGDEKNDWYHRSEKQALYPRFELIAEFRKYSKGQTFHILKLSELLNLLGADEKAVKEVEIEEKIIVSSFSDFRTFALKAERSIFDWLLQRDDLGVRSNQVGYPDYEVNYDDGLKEGVEVIPINESTHPTMTVSRIRDKMFRAYYEIKEKRFDKIKFVFVFKKKDYDFDQFSSNLERVSSDFDRQNIEFIFGYLNDQDEFIQVH